MQSQIPPDFSHASFHGQIGISRVDITPPVGIYARNWGAAQHDVAESVHRPLTLSALTLANSTTEPPFILVDADLGWWQTPRTFTDFRGRLFDELQLDPSRFIFALSHTHAGPPLTQPDPSWPGAELLQEWMETLYRQAVDAIRKALASQADSVLDWHSGRCRLAAVRDLPDPDPGHDRFLCGYNPDREADDMLLLGRVTSSSGEIRATLVNYACHPTTLAWENREISPDYVGAMRQTMQDATGAPALFLLGACGDLAPRFQYVGDPEVADRHGRQLGFAALAALHDMEPPATRLTYRETVESGAPLAVWRHQSAEGGSDLRAVPVSVELPLKNWPTAEELERQRLECSDRALQERLRRKRNIRQTIGDGTTYQLPVLAWRIGDAVLVGCCCEPYSILQQELRQRFPDRAILCMNLINGSLGYMPPAELYDHDIYPVWQTPFDRGCLERTIETMTQAIANAISPE